MNCNDSNRSDENTSLESFVAELTTAAYGVPLRHTTGTRGWTSSWPCGRRSTKRSRGGDKRARKTGRWSPRPFKRFANSTGKTAFVIGAADSCTLNGKPSLLKTRAEGSE